MSIHNISNTIDQALTAAGLDTRSGTMKSVMETIRHALEAARIAQHPKADDSSNTANNADTIDVEARVVVEDEPRSVDHERHSAQRGQFLSFVHTGALGSRAYKLYVPGAYRAEPMPLVVMLHGCKQDPDDFAAGTRFNDVAEELGFLVAYPAQSAKANGSNCWNWFEPHAQTRAGAEPSIIAGIVGEIGTAYRVDERRVFVAGLSAGAAMAVVLGETYPDVFAAVGAHSGLPYGAAHDVASAFAAMHGNAQVPTGQSARDIASLDRAPKAARGVATIVFHGDRDATVAFKNGSAIADQAVSNLEHERGPLTREVQARMAHGRRCTRTIYLAGDGLPVVEQWAVHGGGHAWSGGSAAGSFTEPQGPDASREMMRFFLLHEQRESAVAALDTSV
ncbi:MAG TPA: PHB depolymerase family esterase [Burkholderiaceae bacterium]|jgi:poly(hydroxyalkanoate) depolymerase family esterase